jgi:DNA mismatch repair protein PMS2
LLAEEDYPYVAVKSATSKIARFDDIYGVASFGFRGEALAALCELSTSVTITTRCSDQVVGTELTFDNLGKLVSQRPCPRPVGTTVRVKELFKRIPVRHREFLRALKKQYARALVVLQGYAMSATSVRLLVSNNVTGSSTTMLAATSLLPSTGVKQASVRAAWMGSGEPDAPEEKRGREAHGRSNVLTTSGEGSVRSAIIDVFGMKFFGTLCPAEASAEASELSFSGFVSKAGTGVGRSNNDKQFIFINDRPVDSTKVSTVWASGEAY